MTTQRIEINGETYTFDSKIDMLIHVSEYMLSNSDHKMTLRQLYYRLVGVDIIRNKQSEYQYLSKAVTRGRKQGDIPWDALEDRTREPSNGEHERTSWNTQVSKAVHDAMVLPDTYKRPRWENQPVYLEVWVEKEALSTIVSDVCDQLCVTSFACRGYPSVTSLKNAAERFEKAQERGHDELIIKYLGDFDPTGQDIPRNIREELQGTFDIDVKLERIALNKEQIDNFQLPPEPAKKTDARYEQFKENHGDIAVEVDALPPESFKQIIIDEVNKEFDQDIYQQTLQEEQKDKRMIEDKLRYLINTENIDDNIKEHIEWIKS